MYQIQSNTGHWGGGGEGTSLSPGRARPYHRCTLHQREKGRSRGEKKRQNSLVLKEGEP